MAGIRKNSKFNRNEDVRRRLERALSLSPSNSDSAESSSPSVEGDTTETESPPSTQHAKIPAGTISQDALQDWMQSEELGKDDIIHGEPKARDSRNMIAFQCMANLNARVKSIHSSQSSLADKIETIRSDMEDLVHRLVTVETAMEKMASEEQSIPREGKTGSRKSRRQ